MFFLERFITIGTLTGSTFSLMLAQSDHPPEFMKNPYAEWTALAALCVVVVWLITRTLPMMEQHHERSLQAQRDEFKGTLKEQSQAWIDRGKEHDQHLDRLSEALNNLKTHCMSNPKRD